MISQLAGCLRLFNKSYFNISFIFCVNMKEKAVLYCLHYNIVLKVLSNRRGTYSYQDLSVIFNALEEMSKKKVTFIVVGQACQTRGL